MEPSPAMIERAAKALRRFEYPARFDPRPWMKVLPKVKERFRNQARKALVAALARKD